MDIVEMQLLDGTWAPLSQSVDTPSALYPAMVVPGKRGTALMYSASSTGRLQVVQLNATSLGRTVDTIC